MNEKQLIAEHAANQIISGMLIGLGTGSTANLFIEALALRVKNEGLQVSTVASSVISGINALKQGLEVLAVEQIQAIDCYVDGADEVAPDLTVLKGRGVDLVKEKLLAKASTQFWVLADQSKFVSSIGENNPIPIEVAPFAWRLVKTSLESLGGIGDLRKNAANDGLIITSHGSLVLDFSFPASLNAKTLNQLINNVPGVIEHGIFDGLATKVFTVKNGMLNEIA